MISIGHTSSGFSLLFICAQYVQWRLDGRVEGNCVIQSFMVVFIIDCFNVFVNICWLSGKHGVLYKRSWLWQVPSMNDQVHIFNVYIVSDNKKIRMRKVFLIIAVYYSILLLHRTCHFHFVVIRVGNVNSYAYS